MTSPPRASSSSGCGCAAIFDLESAGDFGRVVASVIGQSPNNLDQIIEIDKGTSDGIRVGNPVVNPAGSLIGKITSATSDRARVMLLTDTNYAVLAKIVRPEPLPAPPATTTTTTPAVGATRRRNRHDDVDDLARPRRRPRPHCPLRRRRCPIRSARPDSSSVVASTSHHG